MNPGEIEGRRTLHPSLRRAASAPWRIRPLAERGVLTYTSLRGVRPAWPADRQSAGDKAISLRAGLALGSWILALGSCIRASSCPPYAVIFYHTHQRHSASNSFRFLNFNPRKSRPVPSYSVLSWLLVLTLVSIRANSWPLSTLLSWLFPNNTMRLP